MCSMKTTTVYVKGMHCRSCEVLIEDALSDIPGVHKVHVNHVTGKVDIDHTKQNIPLSQIEKIIINSGYVLGHEPKSWVTSDTRIWRDVGISAVVIAVLSYIFMATDSTSLWNIKNATGFSGMLLV